MFIHNFSSKRIYIKKWDKNVDDFQEIPSEEESRYMSALNNYEFDQYLGAYPLEKYEKWQEVANYISQEVLNRLYVNLSALKKYFPFSRIAKPQKYLKPKMNIPTIMKQILLKNLWILGEVLII